MSDFLDASLSLIEQEDKAMSETMLQLSVGPIRRDSHLCIALMETARKAFGSENPSDEEMRFVFTGLWHMTPVSRTVSYSRKGFKKQYESEDFFSSRTLDFSEAQIALRDEALAACEDGEDVTEAVAGYLGRLRKFMDTAAAKERRDAQEEVEREMKDQGFRV